MNWTLVILIIVGVIVIGIIIWWLISLKRKRKKENQIPDEVLADFEYVEQRLADSNGELSPQQILWELANDKKQNKFQAIQTLKNERRLIENGEPINGERKSNDRRVGRIETQRLPQFLAKRDNIQSNNSFQVARDKPRIKGTQRSNNNPFINRIRRK